jgi:hypothetical protein
MISLRQAKDIGSAQARQSKWLDSRAEGELEVAIDERNQSGSSD